MNDKMRTILFVCVHNSGRSQMAEAFFSKLAADRAQAVLQKLRTGISQTPLDKPVEEVRRIRKEIKTKATDLLWEI